MSSLIQEYELGPKQTDQLTDGLFKKNDGTTWVRYAGVDYQVTGGGLPATGWTPEGDVLTVQSDGTIAAEPGGGSQPGVAIVRKFPFAFNTPGILTGAALYTPTVGDLLLDAWIEIDTGWDGTTPFADMGTFDTQVFGVWSSWVGQAVPLGTSDGVQNVFSCLTKGDVLSSLRDGLYLAMPTSGQDGLYSVSVTDVDLDATVTNDGTRQLPGVFSVANPIKVCVSQDGTNTGADPGSTVGAAILYLVTATPA